MQTWLTGREFGTSGSEDGDDMVFDRYGRKFGIVILRNRPFVVIVQRL
jgi:hypothetical protein